jgi:hypothetical protein
MFERELKQIWLQLDFKQAMSVANLIKEEYESLFPEVIISLKEGLEDSLQYFHFDNIDHRAIR